VRTAGVLPREGQRPIGEFGSINRGQEKAMPTVIGYHHIKDAQRWLSSPKRQQLFGPIGVTNIRTFVDPQDPTRAAVLMDVPDPDALTAVMQTDAAAEAMEYDGVLPETL
jgi:hypothetical protein